MLYISNGHGLIIIIVSSGYVLAAACIRDKRRYNTQQQRQYNSVPSMTDRWGEK